MKNLDEDDDEYSPTVKEKERREREKRKEVAQRVQDGDYLSNIQERTKVFKSRKDSLVTKTSETDSVCGTKSFLLIVNMDQEGAFYHGGPSLVTQFFTSGVSSKNLHRNFNVRAVSFQLKSNFLSVSTVVNYCYRLSPTNWNKTLAQCPTVLSQGIPSVVGVWLPSKCSSSPMTYP
jgi:hypothetical protein